MGTQNRGLSTNDRQMTGTIHLIEHIFPETQVEINGTWRTIRLVWREDCPLCLAAGSGASARLARSGAGAAGAQPVVPSAALQG